MWSNPNLNVTTKNSLLTVVTFHDHLAPDIRRSSVAFISLRQHKASTTDTNAVMMKLHNDSSHLWLALDFNQLRRAASPPLAPGLFSITLQLDNPYLEVFALYEHLGSVAKLDWSSHALGCLGVVLAACRRPRARQFAVSASAASPAISARRPLGRDPPGQIPAAVRVGSDI